MMPKLGTSLAAASPALVKFGAKFLDKGIKREKAWVRTQEYAPLVTGAIGFGMLYTDTYPDVARSIWDGSVALFSDHVLAAFFNLVDPPASGNPSGNPGVKQLQAELNRVRALLPPGQRTAGQPVGQPAQSVVEF